MEVANKYGMIQPGQSNTQAVRAVFIIDPNGVVRTILYYPLSTGRNFDEIKRIILALQKADADACATPADWRPGDDVIVPTRRQLRRSQGAEWTTRARISIAWTGSCASAKSRSNTKLIPPITENRSRFHARDLDRFFYCCISVILQRLSVMIAYNQVRKSK